MDQSEGPRAACGHDLLLIFIFLLLLLRLTAAAEQHRGATGHGLTIDPFPAQRKYLRGMIYTQCRGWSRALQSINCELKVIKVILRGINQTQWVPESKI